MFQQRLHGEYLPWYLRSLHKDRIDHVGQALIVKGYCYAVVQNHLLEWIRLSRYLSEQNLALPSSISSDIIEEYLGRRFPQGSAVRRRGIRAALRIFLETDAAGEFARRTKPRKPSPSFLYQQWGPPYFHYMRHYRNLTEGTLRHRQTFLKRFTGFLERSGVRCATDLSCRIILDSFSDLQGWGRQMRLGYASALRSFLRWGYSEGIFPQDLSSAVISVRTYRDAKLPEVLSAEEVEKLLATVDRKPALGKRNYAILLLAARYGLRPCDIRGLCFEDIHWREGFISLTQSKTGNQLILPLLEDVAAAVIEYLREGRPSTHSRKIFVRHLAPYEPFAEDNNLAQVMQKSLAQAEMTHGNLRGLSLLRHSLATRLLREGKRMHAISDILGHQDMGSTFIYTKIDLAELRAVAISIKEVCS
jgi:integrase/recombinase XerD